MKQYKWGQVALELDWGVTDVNSEEAMKAVYRAWFPAGSGARNPIICAIIERIADENNWDISTWPRL